MKLDAVIGWLSELLSASAVVASGGTQRDRRTDMESIKLLTKRQDVREPDVVVAYSV